MTSSGKKTQKKAVVKGVEKVKLSKAHGSAAFGINLSSFRKKSK